MIPRILQPSSYCPSIRRSLRRRVPLLAGTLLATVVVALPSDAGALAGPSHAEVPAIAPAARPAALPSDSAQVRIAMTEEDTRDTIVASSGGVSVPGFPVVPAVLVRPLGGGSWSVFTGTGCAGPTWRLAGTVSSPPTVSPASSGSLLTLCEPSTSPTLQGTVSVLYNSNGQARTVNTLPLEEYVSDVVPAESPSSWATLGGPGPQNEPWGFQELEAQAVAVRSYVLANLGWYGGYADTCDLSCQTYRGTRYQTPASVAAAQDTAGQVMVLATGRIATTEYSSSTGGWTSSAAEGSPFTPVADTGDGVSGNPHHDWSATVPLSVIAAHWGCGPAPDVSVSGRNGYGTWGGRVTQLTISGSCTPVTVGVSTFLTAVDPTVGTAVQSNWFTITSPPGQALQIVGHGWGHGIGMGQWGALGYAIGQDNGQGNWRYAQILDHYYQPASLQSLPGSPTFGRPSGGVGGYWEVASDGGIFTFGDAHFFGSAAGTGGGPGSTALLASRSGGGYLDVTGAGAVSSFGDAPRMGSLSTQVPGYAGQVAGGATIAG